MTLERLPADLMISISGIRGIVGQGLTPEVVLRLSLAFGSFCGGGKVIVGRDTRPSGPMIRHVVLAGLMSTGCDVIDMGVCATPSLLFAVKEFGAAGGVIVTASHNPVEWNALKFVSPRGGLLTEEEGKRLYEMVDKGTFAYRFGNEQGTVFMEEQMNQTFVEEFLGIDRHMDQIAALDLIDADEIKKRGLKVVADCCDGAGKTIVPRLLGDILGCRVVELNCTLEDVVGKFPRPPEPLPENLGELRRVVVDEQADVGFACDPDADRLAIVSERGEAIGEEYTLALATLYVLSKRKGTVVVNMSTSRMIDDIARGYGCPVERTRVGEINVGQRLVEKSGVIGGEGNGGVILPSLHLGRDAPLAAALVLQLVVARDKTISEIVDEIPRYSMVKRKIAVEKDRMDRIIDELAREFDGKTINRLDGLRIDEENHWIHVRKSNTEPIMRVIVEARSESQANALSSQLLEKIEFLSGDR